MNINKISKRFLIGISLLIIGSCGIPKITQRNVNKQLPASYSGVTDTINSADKTWRKYFTDPYLVAIIDTALKNNQELNITLQEIEIAKNEVRTRKGEYLPFLGAGAAAGLDKVGRYTSQGASDASDDILPGKKVPEQLADFKLGLGISWEVDIWKKLRNAKKSAIYRYLSSVEGKNFMVTNLVAEIANSYYELIAYKSQLEILQQNIAIQRNALEVVKLEKLAAQVTELAVKRFEAEVLKNQSTQYYIIQNITETENRINFLAGRFPQKVQCLESNINLIEFDNLNSGIPTQLLENRPDVRKAEQELLAANLDIKVAKANFYPALRINSGIGFQAFNPSYLIRTPESLIYTIAGDLVAPLVNRNGIKASYLSANARQIQAAYNYEKTILQAYVEVVNQLSNIKNLKSSYDLQKLQVDALNESIEISVGLFKSARANYMEVLLTQRDAVESKFELVETKKLQLNAVVDIYKSLGGGWN